MSRKIEPPRCDDDEWSAGANCILNMLFYYIGESPKSYAEIEDEAGLGKETLKSWRDETVFPQLDSVLRCLHVLGYSLVIVGSEDSAFAHPGYFAMQDRREEVRFKNAGLPLKTVFGTPEWEEANSFAEWPEPTPEEIATELRFQRWNGVISAASLAALSPKERIRLLAESEAFHEERRKLAEASAKRRAEEHRKRIDEMRQGRKRKGEATPVVKSRKASPSRKAKASAKMARTRERIARKVCSSDEISAV